MFTKSTATLLLALPFLTSAAPALDPRTSGDATFYSPGKTFCGPVHSDDDPIVAISAVQFGFTPDICGRYIRVTASRGGMTRQIVVQVADKCPECSRGSIILTPAAFLMLFGSLEIGRAPVNWDWV